MEIGLGRHAKNLLIVALLSTALRSMGMSIVQVGLPSFVESLAGTLTSYGIIVGIFSLTRCIFQFPFAAASDKLGRRKLVLFGMIIYFIGTILCFTAPNIVLLTIYRAIQGAGAYTSILQAIIGDIYKKDQHSKGMGYYSLTMNIGYLLGFVLGGFISSFLGFRSIFMAQGILICISFIIIFIVLKERDKNEIADSQNNNMDFSLKNIKTLLKNQQYFLALIFNSVRWFIFGFITAYLIWLFQDKVRGFGLSEIISSILMLGIMVLYVKFIYVASRLIKRYGPRKIIMIGQIIVIGFGIFFFFPVFALKLPIFLFIIVFIGNCFH